MSTPALPRHPRTGQSAVGWRKPRVGEHGPQPIWPIRGAAADDGAPAGDPSPGGAPSPAGPPGDVAPSSGAPNGDAPLGPAGEKALEEWKRRAREAEKLAKEHEKRIAAFEDAQKTEADKLVDRAAKAEERAAKATRLAVAAKVEALAAASYQDPEDAVGALDPTAYIDDDGTVDTDAIKKALAELLERKPHWARESGPRQPKPDRGQGPRTGGTPGVEDEIREAQARGDWRAVMRLQNSKLADAAKTP
ncbi:hypothetical protein AB0K09_00490 [Streptomyces sp. NPDC049577]|uniref:hypothetical protein n=1 Tax=Streptomyces sp. NPDC049577 TaxID=3155153 RepID=UPI00341F4E3B